MDKEKCLYGKRHSLIEVYHQYECMRLWLVIVEYCEVCGAFVKKVYAIKDHVLIEAKKTIKIPQIATEILEAQQKKGETIEISYTKSGQFS